MNYEDYVKFCQAQHPDHVIDHSDWGTCSVGKYLSSIGEVASNEVVADLFDMPYVTSCPPQNGEYTKRNLYLTLNQKGDGYNAKIVTYGDLVNFMEKIS
jgi:hypothetical protein